VNEKQAMSLRFRRSTHKALRLLAIEKNTTVQALIEQAAEQIVARAEKAGAAR
jgi:predicted transcriptional regulator